MPREALPPGRIMLGIQASRKEESGMSAGEAALGHVLVVPGELLTTTAPPADTPAPPAVILVAKRTYTEAAATPALDSCCPPQHHQQTHQRHQRSFRRPSGPTLRPLLPLPWMELPTSMCSSAVWGRR